MSAQPASKGRGYARRLLRALSVPLFVLFVWWLAARWKLINPLLLAPPDKVFWRALEEVQQGELLEQLLASVRRDLLGFGIGVLGGALVGGAMGVSRVINRVVGPTFHALKQVAIFAWIPLMSVWLGNGEQAKVAFIALSAFFPVVLHTYEGVRGVSNDYLEVARVFRFTPWQTLRRVVLPAAAPEFSAGIQLALVYAWLGTMGAEFLLAAGPGLGNLMIDGREQLAMDKVLLGIVIVGCVGMLFNSLAAATERKALRHRASERAQQGLQGLQGLQGA
jgi:sulfonate transport system permease protein